MSILAELPPIQSLSDAEFLQAARRKYLAYAVFTLCAGLYVLPFMRLLLRGTDEGFLIDGAVRIVHGQVFARDFFEVVGPGTFYWLALFFRLFGVTFLATRICLFISTLGTALLMYFLARRICRGYQVLPCLLLFSTSFGMLWPAISHHTDSNFFALLAVACMVLWLDRRRDALLVSAGALAAAATCFLQPKGILLFAAILAWLWLQHRRASAPLSSAGMVAAGYAGVGALVLFYFWSHGALRDLVYANALWPFRHYDGVSAVPYGRGILLYYWDHWATAAHGLNWTVAMASVLILPFLFVAAIPLMLPLLGFAGAAEFRHRAHLDQPVIWLYLLCGCALWLSEIHRKDICHLVYGSPLLIVLCVYFLAIRGGRPASLALQLLSICAACLAAFNLFMVLVARPVPTRVGSPAMFQSDPVVTFLDSHAAPGENIFTYPYCPMYYFLSATSNPTRHSILMYNYNTPAQFQQVIRTLDRDNVKYVVWDTNFARIEGSFFHVEPRESHDLILEPYLESHYKIVRDYGGIRVMERNGEGETVR